MVLILRREEMLSLYNTILFSENMKGLRMQWRRNEIVKIAKTHIRETETDGVI